ARRVARLSRCQRSQSKRRQEVLLDGIDHLPCTRAINERDRESSDRENLIGPKTVVACPWDMVDIDHVGEASEIIVPEALENRVPLEYPLTMSRTADSSAWRWCEDKSSARSIANCKSSWTATTYHSDASTALNSGASPRSGNRFGSMPSDTAPDHSTRMSRAS